MDVDVYEFRKGLKRVLDMAASGEVIHVRRYRQEFELRYIGAAPDKTPKLTKLTKSTAVKKDEPRYSPLTHYSCRECERVPGQIKCKKHGCY